ncbi:MAG: 5-oxoprolinase subunit PxpB [Bacteroidales bacterium]
MVYSLEKYILSSVNGGLIETVPSYSGLMVYYNPFEVSFEQLSSTIESFISGDQHPVTGNHRKVTIIPAFYGKEYGPDLETIASAKGLTGQEVIDIHSSVDYRIYMLGFTPGFPYLGGMDERIAYPRRSEPRLKIGAGSVGIAGSQTGIYPVESPGGWQIIGRTPVRLFDPSGDKYFLLEPGDYLRFRPVSFEEYVAIHRTVTKGEYEPETSIIL